MKEQPCAVLVADDDQELRETLAEVLRAEGFEVMEAVDGLDAVTRVLEYQPHVLLLDHRMPRLTGAEACRMLRAQGSQVRIVLITAAREGADMARELNVDGFLNKPFDLETFVSAVSSICQSELAQVSAGAP